MHNLTIKNLLTYKTVYIVVKIGTFEKKKIDFNYIDAS